MNCCTSATVQLYNNKFIVNLLFIFHSNEIMWPATLPVYYPSLSSLLLFTMSLISIAQSSSSASSSSSNQNITTFSIARFNLNQLPYTVRLSGSCRDSIATRERTCYARYLDRFDGFEVKGSAEEDSSSPVLTSDVSSEFERRTCCAIWQWHSCTSPAFNQEHCTAGDWAQWMDWPYKEGEGENGNGVTYLCSGYEYNSVWCWPFPLWTYIAFGLFLVVLLSAGILGVIWFWRRGSSGSSSERERRRRKPVNIRTVRANHKRSQNVYV